MSQDSSTRPLPITLRKHSSALSVFQSNQSCRSKKPSALIDSSKKRVIFDADDFASLNCERLAKKLKETREKLAKVEKELHDTK